MTLRRNRQFAVLQAGQLTSSFGTGLLQLAVLLDVYARTRSTRVTTVAFLSEVVPMVLLSPWAGVIADRLDRRRILVVADLVRALLLLPLLASTALPVLVPVLAVQAGVGAVFRPAYSALLPMLVPGAQLATANAFSSASSQVLALACPPLGAALFATFGLAPVVVVDAGTFVISVLTLLALRVPVAAAAPARSAASTRRASMRHDLLEGVRVLRPLPLVRLLLVIGAAFTMFEAFLQPVYVPFFQSRLHASAAQIGLSMSANSLGWLVSGLVVTAVARRLGAGRMFVAGAVGVAACALAFALARSYPAAVAALVAMGLPATFTNVSSTTMLQTHVPPELLGRAMGLFTGVLGVATIAGAAVPAFATGLFGLRGVVLAAAAATCVAAALAVRGLPVLQAPVPAPRAASDGSTTAGPGAVTAVAAAAVPADLT